MTTVATVHGHCLVVTDRWGVGEVFGVITPDHNNFTVRRPLVTGHSLVGAHRPFATGRSTERLAARDYLLPARG